MRQWGVRRAAFACALVTALTVWSIVAATQSRQQAIDAAQSKVTVHVDSGGLFSFFGDDHLVSGPIASGWISTSEPLGVEFKIDAAKLRVLDPGLSASDRAKVQERMLGPDVLDVERFPAITFASTSVTVDGDRAWTVSGRLTLHGATRDIQMPVKFADGRYRGSVRIRQTHFGIDPVTIALGTVRVKDEIRVEIELAAAPPASGMLNGR